MLRTLTLAAGLSLVISASVPPAQAKQQSLPEKLTFGSFKVLDVATVQLATYSPKTMMLVRTESPSAILLISSNRSDAELRQTLQTRTFGPCARTELLAAREYALASSTGLPVASDLLIRSARDRKPPALHDAQMTSQFLLKVNAGLLAPHFPTYQCELGLPKAH